MNKNSEVKSFFDDTDKYLHKDFGILVRAEIANELIGSLVDGKRIIDLGCGNGNVSLQFLDRTSALHFLDISDKMLDLVKRKIPDNQGNKVDFFNCDLEELQVNQKYDIIIAYGLIMHVNSPEKSVLKMSELLNPNGLLIIQYTNWKHPISRINIFFRPKGNYRLNKIDKTSFKKIIDSAGLVVLKSFSYSLLLKGLGKLPDKLLYRFHRFTFTNKVVSQLGMDDVYLLRKG